MVEVNARIAKFLDIGWLISRQNPKGMCIFLSRMFFLGSNNFGTVGKSTTTAMQI